MVLGAIFGHMLTMMHNYGHMKGLCGGGYGREMCRERGEREGYRDRDDREREGYFEHKFQGEKEGWGERGEKGWSEHKGDMKKHGSGCMCPMCAKMRAACASEPNKANCPMMDKGKKEGKSKKD
jgi:hypothetical protein